MQPENFNPNLDTYRPREDEKEKASNGYLMSVIALMAGMPIPIINLLASVFFYLGNRRSTYYVRWHCMQAMISQITILIINAIGLDWTIQIFMGHIALTNLYLGYVATVIVFNIIELAVNISAAIRVRKGTYVKWWFWGEVADILTRHKPTI